MLALAARAERLPVKLYDTSDGLAGDAVQNLFRDSRGFLWIATSSGLSRFDGQIFRNYEGAEGLPSPRIHDVAEGPDGSIWVATAGGLARLAPEADAASGPFVVEPLPDGVAAAQRLLFDASGILWIGGERLLRLDPGASGEARLKTIALPVAQGNVEGLAPGSNGALWIATWRRCCCAAPTAPSDASKSGGRLPAPRCWRWTPVSGSGSAGRAVSSLLRRQRSRQSPGPVTRATAGRSTRARAPGLPGVRCRGRRARCSSTTRRPVSRTISSTWSSRTVAAMARERRGGVWVGTRAGVTHLGAGGVRTIGVAEGLAEGAQMAVLEDDEGRSGSAPRVAGSRLRPSGFVAFGEADGLGGIARRRSSMLPAEAFWS